jgi:hypothetical protein
MFNLLCAAGTVLYYKEQNRGTVSKAGLEKFKFFQGESDGKELAAAEDKALEELIAARGEEAEALSVPQEQLLLAKKLLGSGEVAIEVRTE